MIIVVETSPQDDPELAALLRAHRADLSKHSPACSVHALDDERAADPDVTFWTARRQGELLGCAALKFLELDHGEIKAMRTVEGHGRSGIGAMLLARIFEEARVRGYKRLSLETGSTEPFAPARAFYEKAGFTHCPPFPPYVEDPWSVFMTKAV